MLGEGGEALEPFAPGGLFGEIVKALDEGEGETLKAAEPIELALEVLAKGVLLLLERFEAEAEFGFETTEAALPAVPAADDSRVDEEAFPLGGFGKAWGFGVEGRRFGLEIGGDPTGGHGSLDGWGLAEGEVLGEAGGGNTFGGAGEQSEEGAASGFGADGAAGEVSGDSGAAESFFNERLIAVGAAKEDRGLIEGDTLSGEGLQAPRDFDAFQSFGGGGKEQNTAILLRWGGRGKEEFFEAAPAEEIDSQVGDFMTGVEGSFVGGEDGGAGVGRLFTDRLEEAKFESGDDGDIDEDDREAEQGVFAHTRGGLEDGGGVGEVLFGQGVFKGSEEEGEVGSGGARGFELGGTDFGHAEFGEGVGEGAGKAGHRGHGMEVGESVLVKDVVGDAGGESLHAETVQEGDSALGEWAGGKSGSQLGKRHAVQAESPIGELRTGPIVGCAFIGAQNQSLWFHDEMA